MTTPELPPLPEMESCATKLDENGYEAWSVHGRIMVHEARERILTARVAELEADAARYRWLASRARKDTAHDRYGNGAHWRADFFADDGRNAIDAAIDAAIAKEPKQ